MSEIKRSIKICEIYLALKHIIAETCVELFLLLTIRPQSLKMFFYEFKTLKTCPLSFS